MSDNHLSRSRASFHGLIPALVVIAIGVFFLARNLGIRIPLVHNWWAWLILIVAVVPLSQAIRGYRTRGGWDAWVFRDLLNAALLVVIALMFLLRLEFTVWWPIFVIFGGFYMFTARRNRSA